MTNNALFGFMIQNLICKKFKITLSNERQINTFKANYDERIKDYVADIVNDAFSCFDLKPVQCTTFDIDSDGNPVPYNFVLDDNSTLSIRTNISGDKVAPRLIGQAGFEKLNQYLSNIYGKKIENQDDIKHLIIEHIEEVFPVFLNALLDADYIIWIFQQETSFNYHIIDGNQSQSNFFKKEKFTFTRDYDLWIESTTLKYDGLSVAEIQVHKNRSFKFRFIMKNLLKILSVNEKNNETIGITAEKTICDIFNLDFPKSLYSRYSVETEYQMAECIKSAFENLPKHIKYCGNEKGIRGGSSKSSFDFILYNNKTLSLKSNIGKMVCPPEVGQPNDKTCHLYFKQFTKEDHIDNIIFKKMVFEHISEMLPIYLTHLFDSDYLLRIFLDKDTALSTGSLYNYQIYQKNTGENFSWNKKLISFSKKCIDDWNESNTVYYDKISLGEFQVHNNRNCFKFRFNFDNLIKILKKYN